MIGMTGLTGLTDLPFIMAFTTCGFTNAFKIADKFQRIMVLISRLKIGLLINLMASGAIASRAQ